MTNDEAVEREILRLEENIKESYRSINNMRKLQALLRTRCSHRIKRYIPDASGNNDWYYQCEYCKEEGKKI